MGPGWCHGHRQVRPGRWGHRCTGQARGALISLVCPALNVKLIKEATELINVQKLDFEFCSFVYILVAQTPVTLRVRILGQVITMLQSVCACVCVCAHTHAHARMSFFSCKFFLLLFLG